MRLGYKQKIIGLAILSGIVFWVLDAALDFYYKHAAGNLFLSLITDKPFYEFITRVLVFIMLLAIGIIVSLYVRDVKMMHGKYQDLFINIKDAMLVIDIPNLQEDKYRISEINQSASEMFGYQKDELLQSHFPYLMTSGQEIFSLKEAILEHRRAVIETVLQSREGENLAAEISVHPCYVSGKPGALVIIKNITARKQHEEAMLESQKQLSILASQLLNAQEAERQRISIGLHDELGQALMLLKFKIGAFLKKCGSEDVLSAVAEQGLLSGVDEIIEYVRRLSKELSPAVLDEIGLSSSIHYLAEEFCSLYPIECEAIEVDQIDNIFPSDTQLNIFRIFQECLTNAARHAQAAKVSVLAKRRDDHVLFMVKDDGKGFNARGPHLACKDNQKGLGIPAMEQRVRMVGGAMEIHSGEGAGTRISFTVPLEKGT